jgi:hypothetical protein
MCKVSFATPAKGGNKKDVRMTCKYIISIAGHKCFYSSKRDAFVAATVGMVL